MFSLTAFGFKMHPFWRGDLGDLACILLPSLRFVESFPNYFSEATNLAGSDHGIFCRCPKTWSWPGGCSQATQNIFAIPRTCVRTCCNAMQKNIKKPCCPVQKGKNRVPVSWRPGILRRPSVCVRSWCRRAFVSITLTLLGTVLKWC